MQMCSKYSKNNISILGSAPIEFDLKVPLIFIPNNEIKTFSLLGQKTNKGLK